MLYNERLESLDLSNNELFKINQIFVNLIRNRSSNLLQINLSDNKIEYEEFSMMMKTVEKESSFGNLHFKLRVLNLMGNPMRDFDFKVQKLLRTYYERKH